MALISERDRAYFKVPLDFSEETGVGALGKTCNVNARKSDSEKKSRTMVVYFNQPRPAAFLTSGAQMPVRIFTQCNFFQVQHLNESHLCM